MTVYELAGQVLSGIFDRYFFGMPDFGIGQEPEIYAAYSIVDRAAHFVSGIKTADSYMVTVAIFTPRLEPGLYDRVENAFAKAGFIPVDGREVSNDYFKYGNAHSASVGFPQKTHYSMDLIINIDKEENE